jgi:hypothetical protein
VAVVQHATLVANIVTTLTLTAPDPQADLVSFAAPRPARIEVLNVSGTAKVYFTVDGSTPTVGGANCMLLPAAVCALTVADETPGPTSTVKLISSGTPDVSVRGFPQ